MRLILFFLSLLASSVVSAVVPCTSPPSYVYQVRTGWGVYEGTSAQEACAKFGVDACGASGCSVGTATPYCYIGGHVDDPNWATSYFSIAVPSGCPAGSTSNGTSCVLDAFSALPRDQQAAIVVKDFPTQSAADAACSRGVAAAKAGKSLADIAAAAMGNVSACPKGQSSIGGVGADGVYHLKCYNSKGDLMSADGVNTPAGQAAADAQAAADLAAASAAAAAASAAAATASAANAAANSNSSSNASSTPPAPTMPDSVAASGIFYTKGAITGGKTLSDVLANFKTNITNVPIISSIRNFFKLDGISGQCPSMSFTWSFFGSVYAFDLGSMLCSSMMDSFLSICGVLFLISAGFFGFRIAFL